MPLDLHQHLYQGYRLDKPEHCDDMIFGMMMQCWAQDHVARPGFGKLSQFLRDHIEKLEPEMKFKILEQKENVIFDLNYKYQPMYNLNLLYCPTAEKRCKGLKLSTCDSGLMSDSRFL